MRNFVAIAVIALTVATTCQAQSKGHDERCQVLEGNGVRVDECDGTKYLSCKDGRCQCPDPANQVFTYRKEVIPNRNKRSPGKKGGGFKKIAIGAAAGAATYHVVSQTSKGFKNGFTTTPPPPKYTKVYSCYSRVGGQCALNYNNVETVGSDSTTTTTTTTAVPEASTAASNVTSEAPATSDNATVSVTTTSTAAPQAAAQVSKLDVSKIPRCVEYAVCKPGSPAAANGNNGTSASSGFMQKVDFDPRIGVCECAPGFRKTSRDLCEKESSGTGATGASLAVIMATLVINKLFV